MHVLIRYAHMVPVQWANGKGRTTELISWEGSHALSIAALPEWRLSIAQLEAPAAFSPLPGVRRHFLPIGTSATLTVNGRQRSIADRTVIEFDGDAGVDLVDLEPRPGHAINLMVRVVPILAAPSLILGTTQDDLFCTCLAAVALETAGGVELFDVLAPNSTASPPLGVAMVHPGKP